MKPEARMTDPITLILLVAKGRRYYTQSTGFFIRV
jgi:hypothetical protein